jgi:predicted DNA-binding transcriptional regulator YafY
MHASRLLSILMRLQARGRMTADEMAGEFEVSVRTIHRDIDQLSSAGIPVFALRGRSGGFRLRDGYRTTLTGLTLPEAEALFLSGLPGPAEQLGLTGILSSARIKLMAALPVGFQQGAERIASRFHLDAAGWFRGNDRLSSLRVVAEAAWSDHMLTLRYGSSGEADSPRRTLLPLGLVLKGGVWYLVAQSGKSVRTYRVAKIYDAEISTEKFERPKDFDLAAHWEAAAHDYEAQLYRERAYVRISPRGMELLGVLGPHVTEMATRTCGKADRAGWMRCTIPIESLESGVGELMRLADHVKVLGPPELRALMAQTTIRVANNYRPSRRLS